MTMFKQEVLSSLKWYFESKNLSLSNALEFRAPLSTEHLNKLRLYYSQYFVSLLSATEFLLENKYPFHAEFKALLIEQLTLEDAVDGETFYSYLRELRNSIVHRRYDLTSASHFANNFPMIVLSQKVKNQSGKKEYLAPRKYLIELIYICELMIGKIIAEHLEIFASQLPSLSTEEKLAELEEFFANNSIMLSWAKEEALNYVNSEEFKKINFDETQAVLRLLRKSTPLSDLIAELKALNEK